MSWTLLIGIVLVLGLALATAILRRGEVRRMQQVVGDRDDATRIGAHRAKLQHPIIDLSRCLGCATCVAVCPEDDVLEIVHGQAVVVAGSRCMGVAACERACPVGAITVTLDQHDERDDIPALDGLEAIGQERVFLAGEVTAQALIRSAILQGTEVARAVADGLARDARSRSHGALDLVIVGAGPAGLAAALEAKRRGLDVVVLEQEAEVGGSVAKYPRRKLVLSEPVDLPLYGRMKQRTWLKEELIELWQRLAQEHSLAIHTGRAFTGLARDEDGCLVVETSTHSYRAHAVCLALGRRGSPKRLAVPGEDLAHVAYALLDAASYAGRRVLVVGAGDSAVEAAVALAEQDACEVTMAVRGRGFPHVRSKNLARLDAAVAAGRVRVHHETVVRELHPDHAVLATEPVHAEAASRTDQAKSAVSAVHSVPVDDVFVLIGGVPPFELLKRAGVSFDPTLRLRTAPVEEQGSGAVPALALTLVLALATLGFVLANLDYYGLPLAERPPHEKHAWLRPGLGLGLWFGIAATVLIVVNLLYLVRRRQVFSLGFGSLRAWMTSHVATGMLALFVTLLHAGLAPRDTSGGHAFWALVVLALTGAVGRYFYAAVPRAANGREAVLADVRARLRASFADGRADRGFAGRAAARIDELVRARQWGSSFVSRVLALLGSRVDLARVLRELRREAQASATPRAELLSTLALARRAHRDALAAAHLEDLRAVMSTWRWLHRWGGALLVLLLVLHIVHALAYAAH